MVTTEQKINKLFSETDKEIIDFILYNQLNLRCDENKKEMLKMLREEIKLAKNYLY